MEVDSWCAANQIELLYYLCPTDSSTAFAGLEDAGYRLVDVRVSLRCLVPAMSSSGSQFGVEQVRLASSGDIPRLETIASSAHRNTRFHADAGLSAERCDALYRHWIVRDFEARETRVFVAARGDDVIGYVTCTVRTPGTGEIGLIAVDGAHQGKGVGELLVRYALSWFRSADVGDVHVVTQGGNINALRLYERCGFTVVDVSLWFHKWCWTRSVLSHDGQGAT
jgi:ribosomal-protein-alanine N-acetyltransferase